MFENFYQLFTVDRFLAKNRYDTTNKLRKFLNLIETLKNVIFYVSLM